MKTIQLTQGQVALVDDGDFERLSQHKWCASWNHYGFVAVRRRPGGGKIFMHREIMNAPDGVDVDHRNRKTLDNIRRNLRLATRSQNMMNGGAKDTPGRTSIFKGVYRRTATGPWIAKIKKDGKAKHLGSFDREKDAAAAYDKAARELFGEFACTNLEGRA